MIKFTSFKKKSYILSSTLIIFSLFIIFFKGLNFGIDFTGGITSEIKSEISLSSLQKTFDENFKDRDILIKKEISTKDNIYNVRIQSSEDNLQILDQINSLSSSTSSFQVLQSEVMEPTFSQVLVENSLYAVLTSLLVIALYVWIRFDWQFAASGLMALIHDIIISFGFISLLGIEFNLSLIAAILLIGGYSINDTIVLFDRLRSVSSDQDIQKTSFVSMIDEAIQLNLRRTIITSFTTILALICLIILAPTSLVHMPLVIIFGVIIGTYSSLFLSLNTVSSLNYEAVLKSAE